MHAVLLSLVWVALHLSCAGRTEVHAVFFDRTDAWFFVYPWTSSLFETVPGVVRVPFLSSEMLGASSWFRADKNVRTRLPKPLPITLSDCNRWCVTARGMRGRYLYLVAPRQQGRRYFPDTQIRCTCIVEDPLSEAIILQVLSRSLFFFSPRARS